MPKNAGELNRETRETREKNADAQKYEMQTRDHFSLPCSNNVKIALRHLFFIRFLHSCFFRVFRVLRGS